MVIYEIITEPDEYTRPVCFILFVIYCQCSGVYDSGLDYGFEQKTKLDLDSLVEKGIGKISCSQRQ